MGGDRRGDPPRSRRVCLGRIWLAAVILLVGLIWLGILPRLAEHPVVRRRIEWNERHGIVPDAFSYSELPAAERLGKRGSSGR